MLNENDKKMTNYKKLHEKAAKIIRYSGFTAKVFKNNQMNQPYEIRVSNISDNELKELLNAVWNLFQRTDINIVLV